VPCAATKPKSLRGWRRSAGAYGETSVPRVPTSLVAHAGRQCRRSSTNVDDVGSRGDVSTPRTSPVAHAGRQCRRSSTRVGDVWGGDVKKNTNLDQAVPRAYARSALNAAPPTAFVRKFEWLSEPLMSSTRMRPSSI
jgi:hypothetical protein